MFNRLITRSRRPPSGAKWLLSCSPGDGEETEYQRRPKGSCVVIKRTWRVWRALGSGRKKKGGRGSVIWGGGRGPVTSRLDLANRGPQEEAGRRGALIVCV